MSFFEDLKNNRDKQIMAISIVFFVLAFPIYFGLAAAGADGSAGLNEVNMYEVTGEVSFIELAAGDEFIADGETLTIDDLSTDSIDDAEDLNIIGVRISMSYGEDEQASGPCTTGPSADTINGAIEHSEYTNSGSGTNDGGSGSHEVSVEWVNTSLIDEVVVMSKAEIIEEIDAKGEGLGSYSAEISVTAEAGGSTPPVLCQRSDGGEEVSYVIELVVFDYDIRPFFDLEEL